MLGSIAGKTTLTAAFVDDVFSLVTLVIMTKLAAGNVTAVDIIVRLIMTFGFLGLGVVLAIKVHTYYLLHPAFFSLHPSFVFSPPERRTRPLSGDLCVRLHRA